VAEDASAEELSALFDKICVDSFDHRGALVPPKWADPNTWRVSGADPETEAGKRANRAVKSAKKALDKRAAGSDGNFKASDRALKGAVNNEVRLGKPTFVIPTNIEQVLGVVSVGTPEHLAQQHASAAFNGVIFNIHAFGAGDVAEVSFRHGPEIVKADYKKADGVAIAHDLYWFPKHRLHNWLPSAHVRTIKTMKDCPNTQLPHYADLGAWPKTQIRVSHGTISSLNTGEGKENADYTCESDFGFCGALVLDEFGRGVGIHYAGNRARGVNSFIPFTELVAKKTQTKRQSFRSSPSQQ
jgi:hypothetical protein